MVYHALRLQGGHGEYILRSALSTDQASVLINMAKRSICGALLLGGALVFLLTVYIILRIRKPLLDLQQSIAQIAEGNLNAVIPVPSGGIVRDLAGGVSDMADQLRSHLQSMTLERNERQTILNAMTEAVILLRPDGNATRYNQSAAQLFHIVRQGEFNISRSGIDELLPAIQKTFESGKPFENEFTIPQIEGTPRTLLIRGVLLPKHKDSTIMLTLTDLTNLKRLESFRSDFVANVSHEIKTPLTCIIGAAETIQEEKNLPPEQFKKLIDMIYQQSNRLNALVLDILSLSSLERNIADQQKEFTRLALDAIVTNAVKLQEENAKQQHIELRIPQCDPIEIMGDCQLLEQAVSNLLVNAIRYSGSPRIDVLLVRQGQNAVIAVQDYGIGIAREHQARIFERFYRVHKERSRALGGTGLGLSIVKHIAALHRGTAEVSSEPGCGCIFRIILPIE